MQVQTSRYHLTPMRMVIINDKKYHVLARVWREGNPGTPLVGMQIWCSHDENQYADCPQT